MDFEPDPSPAVAGGPPARVHLLANPKARRGGEGLDAVAAKFEAAGA